MTGLLLLSAACAAGPPQCQGWGQPVALGVVSSADLDEASGLVSSRAQADLLWTHNDKGGAPIIYALGLDGRSRAALTLGGTTNVDWEDIALGVDDSGAATLFVGDIGDNDGLRDHITVYRLPEPLVGDSATDGSADRTLAGAQALQLRWPDQPVNAEGLAIDPQTNELLLATKEKRQVHVFSADALAASGSEQTLLEVGRVSLADDVFSGGRRVTAMDISPTGDRIYLRTHKQVLVFARPAGSSIADALAAEPCLAPSPVEAQGEALAALAGGFLTLSEGMGPTLWSVAAP